MKRALPVYRAALALHPGHLLAKPGKGIDGILIFVPGGLLIKLYRSIQILFHTETLFVKNTEFISSSDNARGGFVFG